MSHKYIIKSKNLIKKISEKITKANKMVNEYNRLGKTPGIPSYAFINMASSMYISGCLQEAEELLRSAVSFPSKSSNALINLGVIKQSTGNYKQAIKFYLAAYKKDRQNTKALGLWGNCLAMMGKTDEAIKRYEHAIEINKTDADIYLSWGALLIKKEEYNDAKEKLELAVKYNNKDARPLYMLSIVDIETGNYDSALEKLQWVVDATENNFEALHNIAYVYFKKKDYDNAIAYAKKSLAIFRHKVETYLLLGDIYALQNKETESLQFYEMAEMNNLKTFFLYMSWAVSLQKFNRHEQAIEKLYAANDCLSARKVDEVYARLALSYYRTNQKEMSVKNKDKALQLNSNNYMANSIAAEIEIENGNIAQALEHLKKCEEDFENKGHNYMLTAICYDIQGDCENCGKAFEKALEYSPNNEKILLFYGLFLNKLKDYENTKKKLKSISETTKNYNILDTYFTALYNLAKQNSYKYNVEKAVEIAQKMETINKEAFPYKEQTEELKELLRNYE
ncbi:MAG: tetratricopeptide repeat protein [Candidatus Gastranaerophilales bacterium]|nr:tetratricopeptide repeat protein [Candidatus Gastranaerophilales bacterium]